MWYICHFVTTCLNLEDIVLSEISQTEKDKYHMISFICEIQKNELIKLKVELWFPRSKENAEMSAKVYKRPVLRWIGLGDVIYSTITIVSSPVLYTWNESKY